MNKAKKLPVLGQTKTVMPEVLPDPRHARATSSPRARTMAHMQRLIATAAALGVTTGASALELGCGKTTKVPGESDDAGGTGAKPPDTGNTSGYAVVDPMPPPAHCAGVAKLVRASAKFVKQANGELYLEVRFPNPVGRDDFKYNNKVATSYGGTVSSTAQKPDAVFVVVKPDANATNATITVKGNCNAGPSSVMAHVTWTGPITEKTAPTISLDDMYDY
jgi:hypothetical protein